MSEALDRFGQLVIAKCRDAAIEYADMLLASEWKAPGLQSLQSDLGRFSPEQRDVVRRCVIASVDRGVHDLLFALQEENDAGTGVAIVVDGEQVATESDGLHGELFSDEGWFARFSKYGRHPDPA